MEKGDTESENTTSVIQDFVFLCRKVTRRQVQFCRYIIEGSILSHIFLILSTKVFVLGTPWKCFEALLRSDPNIGLDFCGDIRKISILQYGCKNASMICFDVKYYRNYHALIPQL